MAGGEPPGPYAMAGGMVSLALPPWLGFGFGFGFGFGLG